MDNIEREGEDGNALFAVDLATGDRTLLSFIGPPWTTHIGSGPRLWHARSMAWDPAQGRVVVGDANDHRLMSIDVVTGDRRPFWSGLPGPWQYYSRSSPLALDQATGRALLANNESSSVVSMNLTTAAQTVVTPSANPHSAGFTRTTGMALDTDRNRALLIDSDGIDESSLVNQLLAVDLATGALTELHRSLGNYSLRGLVLEPGGATALSLHFDYDRPSCYASELVRIDIQAGTVSALSRSSDCPHTPVGTGARMAYPVDLVLDAANGRVLVIDMVRATLLAVDLATGDRKVISDPATGSGVAFSRPMSLAANETYDHVFVIDPGRDALFSVDLDNGDRTIVSPGSSPGTSVPPLMSWGWWSMRIDPERDIALVPTRARNGLMAIDLTTGVRALL